MAFKKKSYKKRGKKRRSFKKGKGTMRPLRVGNRM